MLDASVIDPIEARLDHRMGPRSSLTVAALLTAIVRNAELGRPYSRRAVAETLNYFTGGELADLGVPSSDQPPKPFGSELVTRRLRQLEGALSVGRVADGVKYDLDWFARAMGSEPLIVNLEATPNAQAPEPTAVLASAKANENEADRGFTKRRASDRGSSSKGLDVVMDHDASPVAAETAHRGGAAARIEAAAIAAARNRHQAAQNNTGI